MHWDGGMGWVALSSLVFMLVLIGGVVALIVAALRWSPPSSSRGGAPEPPRIDPEQILAERFARGEIDEDEYIRRRNTLRRG